MRTISLALTLLPVVALADPRPVAKSISYYEQHLDELAQTIAICHDNSQYSRMPTCENAEAAVVGLHAHGPNTISQMLADERYWSANPIARDGYLTQCQLGTAMNRQFCPVAARSALHERTGQ